MAVGKCVDCGREGHVEEFDSQGMPDPGNGEWLCLPCSYYRLDCYASQFAATQEQRDAARKRVLAFHAPLH